MVNKLLGNDLNIDGEITCAELTVDNFNINGSDITNPLGEENQLYFNGFRVRSGTATALATATDFEISTGPDYGAGILLLHGSNDAVVPSVVALLAKSDSFGTYTATKTCEHAGSGGAVYTITWDAGSHKINFQHNCGSAKSINWVLTST